MSRLTQTVSSRSQGAQCSPVREKGAVGRDSPRTPPGCCRGQGTAPTCNVIPSLNGDNPTLPLTLSHCHRTRCPARVLLSCG